MADREFIVTPINANISFQLHQAGMLNNTMHLLASSDYNSGYAQWIYDTRNQMTDEEWLHHKIVTQLWFDERINFLTLPSYPDYLEQVKAISPDEMVTIATAWMNHYDNVPSPEEATRDEATFLQVMRDWYDYRREEKGQDERFDESIWKRFYQYLQNPQDLYELVMSHQSMMWERFLEPEWRRQKPILEEVLMVIRQMDYTDMSPFEIIEQVTGRDMRDKPFLGELMEQVTDIVFSPSPHVGPYLGIHGDDKNKYALMFFGARLPKGAAVKSPALSRSELLVRLNALSDDTRLQMLELLIAHKELCAQDFITLLDLSQSSASRHLRQLTASGYVVEKRREVAKCYTLNHERIDDTLSALRQFLMQEK